MTLSIIVAVAENGVIGRSGELPWRLSGDLRRFKALTMGHAVIMGRKTWESIGRPLPGRRMIVVTRQPDYAADDAEVVGDLPAACGVAVQANDDEIFIIGGGEIYQQALPLANRLYITRVHAKVDGDAYFPEVDPSHWRLIASELRPADAKNEHPHAFETYERVD